MFQKMKRIKFSEISGNKLFSQYKPEGHIWCLINKRKRTCYEWFLPADNNFKVKEGEHQGSYVYLIRKLEIIKKMKVKVIPIVVGVLGTVPKSLGKEIK